MKKINKNLIIVLVAMFAFGFTGSINAATTIDLGTAANFAVLGGSTITNTGSTVVNGDLGLSPGTSLTGFPPGVINGTQHLTDAVAAQAQADLVSAYIAASSQTGGTTVSGDLGGMTLTPGIYNSTSSLGITGTLTLDGQGNANAVFIFQVGSALTTASGSKITLINGAQSCNVFWQVSSSVTLGTGSSFVGNILALTSVTATTGASVNGRVLARNGAVTLDVSPISKPTCTVTPPSSSGSTGTINVVKVVINDSGGAKTVSDFPLFVNNTQVNSGVTYTFPASTTYVISETSNSNYTQTFSGDCGLNGNLNLNPGDRQICIITNNDIGAPVVPLVPPLIDVVKVPNPLALPGGPGLVEYTYTLRNIGTVPVTNITMVGDTCSPIVLISGDTNNDGKLDLNETWEYTCSTTLTATHTNTVVATGWANGISATDIASATVIVGASTVPPLIHVTKVPSPLTLPAGGGMVTYTKKVTNPGTVALSNIVVTDDKCGPVNYISGDTNSNAKLDTTETWTYTCKENLTKTTTNTVTASGEVNGLTARDFAVATVVVASPKLPNTGFALGEESNPWSIIALIGILVSTVISFAVVLRKRTI